MKQLIIALLLTNLFASNLVAQPEYEIISLGQIGEENSGSQAVSPSGQFVTGFSDQLSFLWSGDTGVLSLQPLPTRPFNIPNGVNDAGVIAGTGATTFFGSSALPAIWSIDSVALLPLPSGETIGRANDINNADLVVGSVDGGSAEQAATFTPGGTGAVLTQTLNGGTLRTAFGVNDAGRIVGQALDPNNAAVIKGFYLDDGDAEATDIGALVSIGHNSAIAFAVSESGLITGSSSLNAGVNSRAFLWSDYAGMEEVPLPAATSSASGRGVNDDGWIVGTAGGATAIPFLFDGETTYRLQDIIVAGGNGWDLVSGTSNGAFGIANDGTIVGRGLLNGNLTAFVMLRMEDDLLLGDVNCDGEVNLLDVAAFIDAFFGPVFEPKADINQDNVVDLLDITPFVLLLSGG